MNIYRSIDKRVKRTLTKINDRYRKGIDNGKPINYYIHPSFFSLYLKRLGWLLLSLILFKRSTYKAFFRIMTTSHFPHLYYSPHSNNNRIKEMIRVLFGYRYYYYKNLYPAYSSNFLLKSKRIEFLRQDTPLISIIVTVYNKLSYTYNCLQSIKDNVSKNIAYEVILVDDCSIDQTPLFFENNTTNVHYIRNSKNIGYLMSNNKAANSARGKFICFLNNDTEVQPAWLESLVELMENDDEIGCVGSKLLYPNNILQEAGGIIYRDGHGANFGRMGDPEGSSYNFIRAVDYCSAASLLVKKDDFVSLGGFDVRFTPAYYEDTDLCFAIRNTLNKKVMYHPLSKVIHFEGISSGREVKEGSAKLYQNLNHSKFRNKWNHALQLHDLHDNTISYRRLIANPTIVVIEDALPSYDKDSGSLRLFRILELLTSSGYHVIFIPENGNKIEPYYSALVKMGIEIRLDFNSSFSVNDFQTVGYLFKVKYIWISRPEINEMYRDKIIQREAIKWIYDTVDLGHIRMFKEAEFIENNALQIAEAEKTKALEIDLAKKADITITVTDLEKQILQKNGVQNVWVVPNVHISQKASSAKAFNERSGLLFIGGYSHRPNVDAVFWLVNEVMPLVWQRLPDVRLQLLGSNPPQEVLDLARDNVLVPGYIEDVSPFFLNSRVFVAPLRFGAGMKGKVGQALEFCLPMVSTSIGAEGMDLEDEKHLLIADEKEHFASQILRLYRDEELWKKIADESEGALSPFSPQTVRKRLAEILEGTESGCKQPGPISIS